MALRQIVLTVVLLSTLGGCAHELPEPILVTAPERAKPEGLRWAVEAALAQRGWTVVKRDPGLIRATVTSNATGDHATVEVRYRPGAVEILYVFQDVGWSRYDRWVQLLSAELRKSVALVGIGDS